MTQSNTTAAATAVSGSTLLLEVALDLANSLNNDDRFDRLLSSVRKAIRCDAVALLGWQQQVLTPLAIQGLSADTLGRRFVPAEHPRLQALCQSEKPLRFAADCRWPDPYDGLLLTRHGDLPVHACMGLPLYSDQQLIGLLTIDSLTAGAFDDIDERTLTLIAALAAATLKTAMELNKLSVSARHAHQLVAELTQEALLRDGGEIIGQSAVMQALRQEIELVAVSDYTVLIQGETGTGKELVARTLQQRSRRNNGPLVYLNCASLPETLAEAELFGHAKGAFTGAAHERPGKFLLADGGTIFLDEVGELPLSVQSKLLRVLQSGEIQPVGKDAVQRVNVRVLAATNRDLRQEVQAGRFRADLYHRLSVYPLQVPPLRQRSGDVVLLAGYFLEQIRRKLGIRQLKLSAAASQLLQQYSWPGNVRELEHQLSRAALKAAAVSPLAEADAAAGHPARHGIVVIGDQQLALTDAVATVGADTAGQPFPVPVASVPATGLLPPDSVTSVDLKQATDAFMRQQIITALQSQAGNWSAAARYLQMDRANLVRLAKRLGISLHKDIRLG